ncbi:hypothetical protein H4N64_39840 [Streptomyces sp. PSKA01]|uniref:Uncharacterized protein n=2 Tax=Streptomyces cupreus TaxID=2759956 RepID=A0A7X1JBG1_9ACTN|nr:hypothetical protein [Streptomyces cupreus]
MALMLCATIHGLPEETHGPVSVPVASAAMVAGGEHHERHAPHAPHRAEDCVADMIVRTGAPSVEDLPLGAMAVVVLIAVSVVTERPLVRHGFRRRRSARTGRVALARTSRWRI